QVCPLPHRRGLASKIAGRAATGSFEIGSKVGHKVYSGMSFLQPFILLGLPLALIPILIHLLNRLRYRSVSWAAMMFILKATRSSTSMAKIRQWLVLLLRVLALVALIFAVARPLAGAWLGWGFSASPDTVIVLLDRSASMGADFADGKNCLDSGLSLVAGTGAKFAADSRILLVESAGMQPMQIPGWDVLHEMGDTRLTHGAADIPSMLQSALDYILENPSGRTEVWIVSDMQESNWRPDSAHWGELAQKFSSLQTSVSFKALSVEPPDRPNRSVRLENVLSYTSADGKKISELVLDVLSGTQSQDADIPVTMFNNGTAQQVNVKVSGKSSRIRLRLPRPEEGGKLLCGYVELPPDSNPADNFAYFAYGDTPGGKKLVFSKDSLLRKILSAAADPRKEGPKESEAKDLSLAGPAALDDVAMVVWQGSLPRGKAKQIIDAFIAKKGAAIFFPPADDSVAEGWGEIVTSPPDSPLTVSAWERNLGPLADTASGDPLPLNSVSVLQSRQPAAADTTHLALLSDGNPLLSMSHTSGGKPVNLYFCSTLPLQEWSNLGEGIVLVPMLERIFLEGARRFSMISFLDCAPMALPADMEASAIPWQSAADEKTRLSESRLVSGVFRTDIGIAVVNRPAIEDILGYLNQAAVRNLLQPQDIHFFHDPAGAGAPALSEIWRVLMMAMLVILLAESFMVSPSWRKSPIHSGGEKGTS
ncbi:MAG: BatA domain-containing protein, partial [Victivallales bacterium]|nr:BatA domain-containing protein [Victivallales bacterium]